jgi:hypothetical protein
MVRVYSRHYRDSSPVNDHQSDQEIRDDPCAFVKVFHRWTANIDALFPLFLWYLQYPRLDRRYHHTKFNLVTGIAFYSFHDILSLWPSHMLQHWIKSHRVGPEYLSVTQKNKFRSWCTCLNILHWKTQETHFQSPCYGVTVDAIKASSGSSD